MNCQFLYRVTPPSQTESENSQQENHKTELELQKLRQEISILRNPLRSPANWGPLATIMVAGLTGFFAYFSTWAEVQKGRIKENRQILARLTKERKAYQDSANHFKKNFGALQDTVRRFQALASKLAADNELIATKNLQDSQVLAASKNALNALRSSQAREQTKPPQRAWWGGVYDPDAAKDASVKVSGVKVMFKRVVHDIFESREPIVTYDSVYTNKDGFFHVKLEEFESVPDHIWLYKAGYSPSDYDIRSKSVGVSYGLNRIK